MLNTSYYENKRKKQKCHTSSNHHFGQDVNVIIDTMSVQKRGVSLNDSTFHMNEGSSFRSLLQLVSSVQKILKCLMITVQQPLGQFLTPVHKLVQKTHTLQAPNIRLGGRHCTSYSKLNSYPRWQKGQVRPEALWRRYSGAPETGNSRNHGDQVRQFSASMVYTLSAPHQLRPYSGERENGD